MVEDFARVDFIRLIARLEVLLPGRVEARISGPDGLSVAGWFPRARLSMPTPHGDPVLMLSDSTRVDLPRHAFVSGDDLGPDESGAVRLNARFHGVVLELGVRPLDGATT